MDFTLRPLEPTDGPALDALLRAEAQTTAIRLTTQYRHDVYASMVAQHPSLFGVVATASGVDGIVGMATAFMDEVQVEGGVYPSVHLENLKVRHDVRRQGLGGRLATWRIEEARRRSTADLVVLAGVDATNEASLATARGWATQVVGPVGIVIATTTGKPRQVDGIRVRPVQDGDLEQVVARANAFHERHNLYPPQTPETLAESLAPTALGMPIRHYRVAVTNDGSIVAGAMVMERFELMTDRIERVPLPLAVVGRIARVLPPDGVIASVELSLAWFAAGHEQAAGALWDAIRHEWHGRASGVVALGDARAGLDRVFRSGRRLQPRISLLVPVRSPVPLDENRPVYLWR